MILLFLALMLVGTLLLGLYDVQRKQLLNRGLDEQAVLCLSLFGSSLFLGIALLGTVLLNVVSQNLFIRAFKLSDASLIAPLRLIIPIIVIVTGFLFLKEVPSVGGMVGIFLTVVGIYVLLFPNLRPKLSLERGVVYGLLGSILFAVSFPLDKIAVVTSSALFASFIIFLALSILTTFLNLVWNRAFITRLFETLKVSPAMFIGVGITGAGGLFLTNQALNYSLVAYASSLKRLQAVWTVIFAGTFLREKQTIHRLVATVIVFAGILVTTFFQ